MVRITIECDGRERMALADRAICVYARNGEREVIIEGNAKRVDAVLLAADTIESALRFLVEEDIDREVLEDVGIILKEVIDETLEDLRKLK